jgi:hypothetical protein
LDKRRLLTILVAAMAVVLSFDFHRNWHGAVLTTLVIFFGFCSLSRGGGEWLRGLPARKRRLLGPHQVPNFRDDF